MIVVVKIVIRGYEYFSCMCYGSFNVIVVEVCVVIFSFRC